MRSLPLRERGLKSADFSEFADLLSSLPLRERGLKSVHAFRIPHMSLSLPLLERGLKSICIRAAAASLIVAPLAGAWIEISS